MNVQNVVDSIPEIHDVSPEDKAEILKIFHTPQKYIRVGPKGYFLTKRYIEHASSIFNMPLKSGDVFVASYQRSGTTWTQELVWLVANDLDYATSDSKPLTHRYPFLEMATFFDAEIVDLMMEKTGHNEKTRAVVEAMATPATEILANMPSPRFVKTHLPMSLLPHKLLDTAKVVYVARDPRDVAVSCYYHSKLFKILSGFVGDFKQFWNLFVKDLFNLEPYFEHVKEAWEKRHDPNMLFLFYEELLKDMPASVRRVSEFFGKELTEEQIARLCDHLSIENFKKNQSVNYEDMREFGILTSNESFIRKGKSGGWREYFDEEMTRQAEEWIIDNLRDTDLRFPSMTDIPLPSIQ